MQLQEFVTKNRDALIAACELKVAKRTDRPDSPPPVDHGVPVFLDQLVEELRVGLSGSPAIAQTARAHGHDLLRQGYSVHQVVHGYGDVCQAITEMAPQQDAPISTDDFRMLNRLLDDAIAGAVTQFGHERDRHIDGEAAAESDRAAVLAVELRRLIRTSSAAMEVIASGSVGIMGSTGTILREGLRDAAAVVDRLNGEIHARRPKHQADHRSVM